MNVELLRLSIEKQVNLTFARSGGPGGQNVNKVNTKVNVSLNLGELEGITTTELARIRDILASRCDSEGNLYLSVEDERSQFRNREIALERIFSLITFAAKPPIIRIKTRPTRASKIRRLTTKAKQSSTKSSRKRPSDEE